MKTNQNDLIIRIVAVVLALIACGVIAYNQPQPFVPPAPEPVPAVKLELPTGTVVKTRGLPAGENNTGGDPSQPMGNAPQPSAPTVAMVNSDSAPMRRLIQKLKQSERVIDATHGRKTKAVIFTTGDEIVLSALSQETLARRLTTGELGSDEE